MIFGIHIDRLQYKTAYHYETVRPWKIYDASKYLVENSTLYKEEGIQLDTSWMNRDDYSEHEVNFIVDEVKNSYATEEHAEAEVEVEVEWGFYALSASKAIFRARTYNCNLFSPVMMIT